ncbi:AraC family transcriptional regulator [uncultured Chryseobacterium sp.]|uniref:helix-turn-helix domain-containing protein n=1 Tax=uncultured Chryseobacterium sp. TaxID=259322 RepID=UPI0025DDEB48|nr:AraC family transcriptional regulator [uncultured Chryseobacterium sp.]
MRKKTEIIRRGEEITENFIKYLDVHITEVVSGKDEEFKEINQIAQDLFITHKHLSETIKAETGYSPCYFYDNKIIEKAKTMLCETDKTISQIANIFTYDPSNFSKFFKKQTGITPKVYRMSVKKITESKNSEL